MKNYYYRFLFCSILIILSVSLFGSEKGEIVGNIRNAKTNELIQFATVELYKAKDSTIFTGVVSTEQGAFKITNVPYGRYYMRISSMGYKPTFISKITVSAQSSPLKLNYIDLVEENLQLEEVRVTGHRVIGQVKENKTIYQISNEETDIAHSGIDLLRQIPELDVNFLTNEVRMFGSSKILFLVNGKRVNPNYLMQLDPKTVQRVETIANPGVRYDSDVDGVINFVLKRSFDLGVNGRIQVDIPTHSVYYSKNNNANVDLNFKKVRLYLGGNLELGNGDILTENDWNNINGLDTTSLHQSGSGVREYKTGGMNFGSDWFINDKNLINFYTTVRFRLPNEDNFGTYSTYMENGASAYSQATSINESDDFQNDYSLYYKRLINPNGHEFSIETYYSNYSNSNQLEYEAYSYDPVLSVNNELINRSIQSTSNEKERYIVKGDYQWPITNKLKLGLGYSWIGERIRNTYDEQLSVINDKMKYREDRQASYLNLSYKQGKWYLSSGIRMEYVDMNIKHEYDSSNTYTSWLPFASLLYNPNKKNAFRLTYRRSIERPLLSQLNSFNYRNDIFEVIEGNPSLSHAYRDKIELTHRYQINKKMNVSYSPYYINTIDGIQQITIPSSDSVLTKKYLNVSSMNEIGLTMNGSFFIKFIRIQPFFTLYQREYKDLQAYNIEGVKQTSWRVGLNSLIILPKNWMVLFNYSYNSPEIIHQTEFYRNYAFIGMINKKVNNKLNLSIITINPFGNNYILNNSQTISGNLAQNYETSIDYSYLVYFRIRYSFGTSKKGKKLKRDLIKDPNVEEKKFF